MPQLSPHSNLVLRIIHSIPILFRKIFNMGEGPHVTDKHEKHYKWYQVLTLTGVDYFSTIAYQPGIALLAVGALAPFSTLLLILVTLFGAVPTYIEVSKRSYSGQGSIAILESLLSGWSGKLGVIALIAFAVTDFVITITLSSSDAAAHLVENVYFKHYVGHDQIPVALGFVIFLAIVFYIGIREAIVVAISVTIPFLLLNLITILYGMHEVFTHPYLLTNWIHDPQFRIDYFSLFIVSAIAFPKLALGLSGFETGVSVMPLIEDKGNKRSDGYPENRIRRTKYMLITAATIMSFYLMTSSVVSSVLIKRAKVADGGEAAGRALSYLAHKYVGSIFGTVYDISSIVILWFAGASAMAGLLAIIPRYLPRFGMAPKWVETRRPLVILIGIISVIILLIFKANVNKQSGAYATGVLALILSASFAVFLSFFKEYKSSHSSKLLKKIIYFAGVALVFAYTFLDNILERPDGIIIASSFFLIILLTSAVSRWQRAFELRIDSHQFVDQESERLFQSIKNKQVNLVPISSGSPQWFHHKKEKILQYYRMEKKIAYLTIHLRDDRSDFLSPLELRVRYMKDDPDTYWVEIFGAVAIPNTVAYISEQLDPVAIYLGLARKNAMEQALFYLLFGEGEIGILTYKVLVQYWETSNEDDVRPKIFLMSE